MADPALPGPDPQSKNVFPDCDELSSILPSRSVLSKHFRTQRSTWGILQRGWPQPPPTILATGSRRVPVTEAVAEALSLPMAPPQPPPVCVASPSCVFGPGSPSSRAPLGYLLNPSDFKEHHFALRPLRRLIRSADSKQALVVSQHGFDNPFYVRPFSAPTSILALPARCRQTEVPDSMSLAPNTSLQTCLSWRLPWSRKASGCLVEDPDRPQPSGPPSGPRLGFGLSPEFRVQLGRGQASAPQPQPQPVASSAPTSTLEPTPSPESGHLTGPIRLSLSRSGSDSEPSPPCAAEHTRPRPHVWLLIAQHVHDAFISGTCGKIPPTHLQAQLFGQRLGSLIPQPKSENRSQCRNPRPKPKQNLQRWLTKWKKKLEQGLDKTPPYALALSLSYLIQQSRTCPQSSLASLAFLVVFYRIKQAKQLFLAGLDTQLFSDACAPNFLRFWLQEKSDFVMVRGLLRALACAQPSVVVRNPDPHVGGGGWRGSFLRLSPITHQSTSTKTHIQSTFKHLMDALTAAIKPEEQKVKELLAHPEPLRFFGLDRLFHTTEPSPKTPRAQEKSLSGDPPQSPAYFTLSQHYHACLLHSLKHLEKRQRYRVSCVELALHRRRWILLYTQKTLLRFASTAKLRPVLPGSVWLFSLLAALSLPASLPCRYLGPHIFAHEQDRMGLNRDWSQSGTKGMEPPFANPSATELYTLYHLIWTSGPSYARPFFHLLRHVHSMDLHLAARELALIPFQIPGFVIRQAFRDALHLQAIRQLTLTPGAPSSVHGANALSNLQHPQQALPGHVDPLDLGSDPSGCDSVQTSTLPHTGPYNPGSFLSSVPSTGSTNPDLFVASSKTRERQPCPAGLGGTRIAATLPLATGDLGTEPVSLLAVVSCLSVTAYGTNLWAWLERDTGVKYLTHVRDQCRLGLARLRNHLRCVNEAHNFCLLPTPLVSRYWTKDQIPLASVEPSAPLASEPQQSRPLSSLGSQFGLRWPFWTTKGLSFTSSGDDRHTQSQTRPRRTSWANPLTSPKVARGRAERGGRSPGTVRRSPGPASSSPISHEPPAIPTLTRKMPTSMDLRVKRVSPGSFQPHRPPPVAVGAGAVGSPPAAGAGAIPGSGGLGIQLPPAVSVLSQPQSPILEHQPIAPGVVRTRSYSGFLEHDFQHVPSYAPYAYRSTTVLPRSSPGSFHGHRQLVGPRTSPKVQTTPLDVVALALHDKLSPRENQPNMVLAQLVRWAAYAGEHTWRAQVQLGPQPQSDLPSWLYSRSSLLPPSRPRSRPVNDDSTPLYSQLHTQSASDAPMKLPKRCYGWFPASWTPPVRSRPGGPRLPSLIAGYQHPAQISSSSHIAQVFNPISPGFYSCPLPPSTPVSLSTGLDVLLLRVLLGESKRLSYGSVLSAVAQYVVCQASFVALPCYSMRKQGPVSWPHPSPRPLSPLSSSDDRSSTHPDDRDGSVLWGAIICPATYPDRPSRVGSLEIRDPKHTSGRRQGPDLDPAVDHALSGLLDPGLTANPRFLADYILHFPSSGQSRQAALEQALSDSSTSAPDEQAGATSRPHSAEHRLPSPDPQPRFTDVATQTLGFDLVDPVFPHEEHFMHPKTVLATLRASDSAPGPAQGPGRPNSEPDPQPSEAAGGAVVGRAQQPIRPPVTTYSWTLPVTLSWSRHDLDSVSKYLKGWIRTTVTSLCALAEVAPHTPGQYSVRLLVERTLYSQLLDRLFGLVRLVIRDSVAQMEAKFNQYAGAISPSRLGVNPQLLPPPTLNRAVLVSAGVTEPPERWLPRAYVGRLVDDLDLPDRSAPNNPTTPTAATLQRERGSEPLDGQAEPQPRPSPTASPILPSQLEWSTWYGSPYTQPPPGWPDGGPLPFREIYDLLDSVQFETTPMDIQLVLYHVFRLLLQLAQFSLWYCEKSTHHLQQRPQPPNGGNRVASETFEDDDGPTIITTSTVDFQPMGTQDDPQNHLDKSFESPAQTGPIPTPSLDGTAAPLHPSTPWSQTTVSADMILPLLTYVLFSFRSTWLFLFVRFVYEFSGKSSQLGELGVTLAHFDSALRRIIAL